MFRRKVKLVSVGPSPFYIIVFVHCSQTSRGAFYTMKDNNEILYIHFVPYLSLVTPEASLDVEAFVNPDEVLSFSTYTHTQKKMCETDFIFRCKKT